MDSYNFIEFLRSGHEIAEFSGSNVAALTGLMANGDQQSSVSNRFINFNLGNALYDEVVLSTTNFAFEVDNIAIGAPVHVPEPPTMLLVAAGLFAIHAACRRKTPKAPSPPGSASR